MPGEEIETERQFMAIMAKVKDVFEAKEGTSIPAIQGKLIKLFKPSSGVSEHGPWSFQNGELKDETGTIKIVFKDCDAVSQNWRDREIMVESTAHSKGTSGVKAKDDKDKKSGQMVRVVWVTKTAEMSLVEGGKQPSSKPRQEEPRRDEPKDNRREEQPPDREPDRRRDEERPPDKEPNEPRGQRQQEQPRQEEPRQEAPPMTAEELAAKKAADETDAIHEARKVMMQSANFMILAIGSVEKFIAPHFEKKYNRPMPEAWRQACAATIFIESKGRVPISKMPTSPIEKPPTTEPK